MTQFFQIPLAVCYIAKLFVLLVAVFFRSPLLAEVFVSQASLGLLALLRCQLLLAWLKCKLLLAWLRCKLLLALFRCKLAMPFG